MEAKAEQRHDDEAATSPSAKSQLRNQGETLGRDLRELGHLTKEAAQETLRDTRQSASELYDQGRRKAGDLEAQVAEYVKEKPVQSVLIAAGVGLLLGALLSRR